MSVLIVTEPDDIHAILVKLALEHKGFRADLFFTADMPSIQKNNVYISNRECVWNSMYSDERYLFGNKYDVIWWRRPRRPYVPDNVHQDDAVFVKKENSIYHDSIPYLLNDNAWWVNPIASQLKTRSKIVQLKIAQSCGFKLPETLISNSPEDIRTFVQSSSNESVIYKPFSPQYWAEQDGLRLLYTDKITSDDLPSDNMLQVVPGIFQRYVEKKYEIRVTCFGAHISAVKIDSQKDETGKTDWRKIPTHELALSEVDLPAHIKNKINLFMIKSGVVFGCFDFIVTPDDDVVFLELNEQGQFLWVEQVSPYFCYLDRFSQFLIDRKFNFSWNKSRKTVYAKDFDQEAEAIAQEQIAKHVYLNQIKRVA